MKKQIKKLIAIFLMVSGTFCFGNYKSEPLVTVTVQTDSEDLTVAISDGMEDYIPSDYPNLPYYSFNLCVENTKTGERKCKVIQVAKSGHYPLWPHDLDLPFH